MADPIVPKSDKKVETINIKIILRVGSIPLEKHLVRPYNLHLKESGSYYKQVGHLLARRDNGYWCHYCGHQLIPPGTILGDPQYYEKPDVIHRYSNGVYVVHAYKPGIRVGSVDHVIPRHKGGGDELSNLVLACKQCNSAKRDRDYGVFVERRDESIPDLKWKPSKRRNPFRKLGKS